MSFLAWAGTTLTLLVLVRAANVHDARTFRELVLRALGPRWALTTSVMVTLYIFGACCSYLIILADSIEVPLHPLLKGGDEATLRRLGLTAVGWAMVFPLCLQRSLSSLERVSAGTIAASVFIAAVVATRALGGSAPALHQHDYSWAHLGDWLNSNVSPLNALPIALLAFQSHIQVVPILYELAHVGPSERTSLPLRSPGIDTALSPDEAPLRDLERARTAKWSAREWRMAKFVFIAGGLCLGLYVVIGILGYLSFGNSPGPLSNVLDSYAAGDTLARVAHAVVGLVMVVSYPVNCFCARSALCDLVVAARGGKGAVEGDADGGHSRGLQTVVVTIFFALTYAVALFVTNLGVVFSILGATVGVYVILVLPAVLLITEGHGMEGVFACRKLVAGLLFMASAATLVFVLTMQAVSIIHPKP